MRENSIKTRGEAMINNSVYSGDRLVGFRCLRCGEVVQSMMGEVCNKCRHDEQEMDMLRAEIRRLSTALRREGGK